VSPSNEGRRAVQKPPSGGFFVLIHQELESTFFILQSYFNETVFAGVQRISPTNIYSLSLEKFALASRHDFLISCSSLLLLLQKHRKLQSNFLTIK
jgi:hypothetical protein